MEEDRFPKPIMQPVLFLDDDWPEPPKSAKEENNMSEYEAQNMNEVRRWRLQTLLAINPWGIPSLAFTKAYEKMFKRELDIKDLGFDTLSDMIFQYSDIFTVQEPNEMTSLMFPDYPNDLILHDARLNHDFSNPISDSEQVDYKSTDTETLIAYAWFNQDDDFPPDVVLAGEQYADNILPMTSAKVPGTRGLYQAVMVGAANPDYFHVNIKTESLERLASLSNDIGEYFRPLDARTIATYSVPNEFLYPGFPCLVYLTKERCWERASIIAKSKGGNKILVEAVDYGGMHSVNPLCLYLMPRKFFDIPKQNIPMSLIGMKPGASNTWPVHVGERMRCFSDHNYWLDILLIEPKEDEKKQMDEKSSSSSGCGSGDSESAIRKSSKYKKRRNKIRFEALVCDRNDPDIDIYLDEILFMENYAIPDSKRADEILSLKQKLNQALATVPRPENPLK